jgi:hypothetical protein
VSRVREQGEREAQLVHQHQAGREREERERV